MALRIVRARYDIVVRDWMVPIPYFEHGWGTVRSLRIWPTRWVVQIIRS